MLRTSIAGGVPVVGTANTQNTSNIQRISDAIKNNPDLRRRVINLVQDKVDEYIDIIAVRHWVRFNNAAGRDKVLEKTIGILSRKSLRARLAIKQWFDNPNNRGKITEIIKQNPEFKQYVADFVNKDASAVSDNDINNWLNDNYNKTIGQVTKIIISDKSAGGAKEQLINLACDKDVISEADRKINETVQIWIDQTSKNLEARSQITNHPIFRQQIQNNKDAIKERVENRVIDDWVTRSGMSEDAGILLAIKEQNSNILNKRINVWIGNFIDNSDALLDQLKKEIETEQSDTSEDSNIQDMNDPVREGTDFIEAVSSALARPISPQVEVGDKELYDLFKEVHEDPGNIPNDPSNFMEFSEENLLMDPSPQQTFGVNQGLPRQIPSSPQPLSGNTSSSRMGRTTSTQNKDDIAEQYGAQVNRQATIKQKIALKEGTLKKKAVGTPEYQQIQADIIALKTELSQIDEQVKKLRKNFTAKPQEKEGGSCLIS